jgi:hypothetical protein
MIGLYRHVRNLGTELLDRLFVNPSEAGALAASIPSGDLLRSLTRGPVRVLSGDGAIPVDVDGTYLLTKGSAAAMTLAVPGAGNEGRRITITGGTDFAHVVTAASTSVHDGTTGGHGTLTSPAFQGGTLTLVAVTAAKWNVEANNLWVIT